MSQALLSPIRSCPFRSGDPRLSELCRALMDRLLILRGERFSLLDLEQLLCDPEAVGRTLPVHITTSCVLYNLDRSAVGMLLHRKREEWFYPGGHPDGSWNWFQSAVRECFEETGMDALSALFESSDVWDWAPSSNEHGWDGQMLLPALIVPHPSTNHYHLDFVYALESSEPSIRFDSRESLDGKWFELAPLLSGLSPDPRLSAETLSVLRAMEDHASRVQEAVVLRIPKTFE